MCGIVGFANRDTNGKYQQLLRGVFEQLLWIDTLRGADGTGVAAITGKELEVSIYKNAMYAPEFMNCHGYRNTMWGRLDGAHVAIGHNRAATRGTVRDNNSHPFQHNHITLVHNGFLQNSWDLNGRTNRHDVDSYAAAYAIAELGEKEALEQMRGAFALVWWNSKDNTLNMARNDSRELWVNWIEDHDTLLWASEWLMMQHVLTRNALKPEGKYKLLTPFHHFKFSLNNLKEYQKLPFAEPPSYHSNQSAGGFHGASTNSGNTTTNTTNQESTTNPSGIDSWRGSKRSGSSTVKITPAQVSATEVERIQQLFDKLDPKVIAKRGLPDSKKKIKSAYAKLHNIGYSLGREFISYIEQFVPYKNQTKFGVALGSRRGEPGISVEIPNCTRAEFDDLKARSLVFVYPVNVKKSKHGADVLVCNYRTEHYEVPNGAGVLHHTDPETGNTRTLVKGPRGSFISLETFRALTAAGCSNCTGNINPNFSHAMAWFDSEPLCHICAADPDVMGTLNMTPVQQHATH